MEDLFEHVLNTYNTKQVLKRVGFLWQVIIGMYASWSPPDLSAPAPKRKTLVLAGSVQKRRVIDMLFCSSKDVRLQDSPFLFFSLCPIAWSLLAPFLQFLSAQGMPLLNACLTRLVSRG